MEALGQTYLRRMRMHGATPQQPPTEMFVQYRERSLRPPPRLDTTLKKVYRLIENTQIPMISYDGTDPEAAVRDLTTNLDLYDCSLFALENETPGKLGHMVAFVRTMTPTGPVIEYFDSQGTPLEAFGEGMHTSDGLANPTPVINGLIDEGSFVDMYQPPIDYLRYGNGIQVPENNTCALQSLMRVMNRNLTAKEYYQYLRTAAQGTYYDSYMIQAIEDLDTARTKVLEGKTYEVDWMQGEVVPYSVLRKSFLKAKEIQALRYAEMPVRGAKWLTQQLEVDDIETIEFAKWASDQAEMGMMLFQDMRLDPKMVNNLEARAKKAERERQAAMERLAEVGYTDIREIMEDVEAERRGETITPPDVEEFTPEEQARIDQRAAELRQLIGAQDIEVDSYTLFQRRVQELRGMTPQ